MRVDLYTTVHKAQRFHLFHLSQLIAHADPRDRSQMIEVKERVLSMIEHLRDHARNEETYIHPLFAELGDSQFPRAFESMHHEFEAELDELDRITKAEKWSELYPSYHRFLGRYLTHLDEEEKAQATTLWPNFTDERLRSVFNRFKAERPSHLAADDMEFMLPALNVVELAGMLSGMKATAPTPIFEHVCKLAEKAVEPTRWAEVRKLVLSA